MTDPQHYLQALVRSDLFLEFFPREFAVMEYLSKETTADGLATVDGNYSAAAVGMAKEVMAAFDADEIEPKTTQHLEEVRAGDGGESAHAMTATR